MNRIELIDHLKAGRPVNAKIVKEIVTEMERMKVLEEALTPSAETKAAFISEFSFVDYVQNGDGEGDEQLMIVPWTTIKEIMKAIKQRAEATCQK